MVLSDRATFDLAQRLRGREGAAIGEVFAFVGRGDMSRGGLLLRCMRAGEELEYVPVEGAIRHGPRPPKLAPIRGISKTIE